ATGKYVTRVPATSNQWRIPFSADGKLFATIGKRVAANRQVAELRVWNAATGEPLLDLDREAASIGAILAISPDGRHLAGETLEDQAVKIWRTGTGEVVHTFAGPDGPIRCLEFSRDGRFLAVGSGNSRFGRGEVKVWDVASGAELSRLAGHADAV